MGAWGAGILEDDTSLDFLETHLLPQADPRSHMRAAFEQVLDAAYIDYDAGCAALASAAALRAALLGEPLDDEPPEWTPWREKLATLDLADLRPLARKACRRVLSEDSELYQLWQENDELFSEWKRGVESVVRAVAPRS